MSSVANLYPAPGAVTGTTGSTAAGAAEHGVAVPTKAGRLVAFEGFLKKAGHVAGVVLAEITKYVIPVASVVAIAEPEAAPAIGAFLASVKLVQATVISVQQKWAAAGSEANAQKLADVLEIVEAPVVTMFAQAGIQVDRAYITNLVNGVVAILNAQPGVVLRTAA